MKVGVDFDRNDRKVGRFLRREAALPGMATPMAGKFGCEL
jgi:hypothetical protein